MNIKLTKPICFFDLETTSIDPTVTRIVEISICKLYPNGSKDIKTRLINPEIPISASATAVHGISDQDVSDKPTFQQIANNLLLFIGDSDLGGFNSNKFDIPVLVNEFQRVGLVFDYRSRALVDVGNIFKIKEQRTLSAACKFYLGKDLENAHSAEADIIATVDVFKAQLVKYPDLPTNMAELAKYSNFGKDIIDISGKFARDVDGDLIFTFGKHKEHKCRTEPGFLEWMLRGDFTADTKQIARDILDQKIR